MSGKEHQPHPYDVEEEVLSKTQKKQMVHDLQHLAKAITAMPKNKLNQIELPTAFVEAITESKRINSHIARKRHFQYMAKLLLKADHEAIRTQIEQIENLDGHYQIRDAVINLWIDQMATDDQALFDYLYQHFEHETLAQLRQHVRAHVKKPEDGSKRKKLFQALRQLDQKNELPNPETLT